MHEPTHQHGDYRAYMLRLWREHAGAPWRASLQLVASGERTGFADIEELAAFLRRLAGDTLARSPDDAIAPEPAPPAALARPG